MRPNHVSESPRGVSRFGRIDLGRPGPGASNRPIWGYLAGMSASNHDAEGDAGAQHQGWRMAY
jgi:hypothetical protein